MFVKIYIKQNQCAQIWIICVDFNETQKEMFVLI